MILDETEYEVVLDVGPIWQDQYNVYKKWAQENGFEIRLAFSKLYIKKREHAVLFRLKFGL